MRTFLFFAVVSCVGAQNATPSQTNVYTYDTNGNRVLANQQVTTNGSGEQRVRNLNGRMAPLERVEEKVLREDSTGRVVERVIRSFDASGAPLPPERIRITEQKQPGGVRQVSTEVFRGNLNGGFVLSEKREAVETTSGDRVSVQTTVGRPTINGGVDTVEKVSSTIVKTGEKTNEDTLTYRRDANGSFYPAAREVKEIEKKNGTTVESTATYIRGERSELELAGQTVAETVKRADGSETKQVSLYGMNAPGRPVAGQPVLREQQIIEKTRTGTGAVETFSIRRPAVDDPNALGPVRKISEKVCTGPCQ